MRTVIVRALIAVLALIATANAAQERAQPAIEILHRYVQAIGGEEALRAVRTRITEGEFDNGRGLVTRYLTYEQAPDKRVTLIGTRPIDSENGSGRGFDGAGGWDKNFIGTGLRTVSGSELADLKRDADILRPLHLLDDCVSTRVGPSADSTVIACQSATSKRIRWHFDRASGLLVKQETDDASGRGTITVLFEDYRTVDRIRLPFETRINLPGATVTYTIRSVRYNEPVQEAVFRRPSSD